jgi:hypothetical protein
LQVIAAEGEQKASKALREASLVMAESSSALQLRYLQVKEGRHSVTSSHRYLYRIDNLVKASTCNILGTASIDCQIPLVADFDIFEMCLLEEEKERKRVKKGDDWSL